jgi:DNA-binding transcriptional regulator YbjK
VRTALLDTAEALVGTAGVEVVSLRAVAPEAGVAPAALSAARLHDPLESVI